MHHETRGRMCCDLRVNVCVCVNRKQKIVERKKRTESILICFEAIRFLVSLHTVHAVWLYLCAVCARVALHSFIILKCSQSRWRKKVRMHTFVRSSVRVRLCASIANVKFKAWSMRDMANVCGTVTANGRRIYDKEENILRVICHTMFTVLPWMPSIIIYTHSLPLTYTHRPEHSHKHTQPIQVNAD